jgi:D-alanyl-D-alanine carboxypeptidase
MLTNASLTAYFSQICLTASPALLPLCGITHYSKIHEFCNHTNYPLARFREISYNETRKQQEQAKEALCAEGSESLQKFFTRSCYDMKLRKKPLSFLLILLILQIAVFDFMMPAQTVQAAKKKTEHSETVWPKCPKIDAEACCVMDLSSGLVLYSKNMKKKNFPASITKIMTTLLTIENCSLGEEITFSAEAVNSIPWDGTKLGVVAGETLSVEQSLYAIMLQSANDVCAGVAEYISGSQEEFAKLMTKRAREIGCVNTNFTNPHGLHDDNHYTCAYDMCLIGREAMKNSIFRTVTASRTYTVAATNASTERVISNHHQMINGYRSNYAYEYDKCIGGKTGYTSAAGNTLVTFAKKDDMELVCVVMRANGTTSQVNEYTDTKKLIEAAFDNYQLFPIDGSSADTSESAVSDDSPMFTKYNRLLSADSSAITTEENSYLILPKGVKKKKAKQTITYFSDVTLSDTEDTVIGSVSYTYGGKEVGKSDIIYHPSAQKTLTGSGQVKSMVSFRDRLTSGVKNVFLAHRIVFIAAGILIGIVILLFLILVIYSNLRYSRPKQRRRKPKDSGLLLLNAKTGKRQRRK